MWNATKQSVDELTKLALRYKTNKTPQFGNTYTDFYFNMFSDKRASIKKVLQIGLGEREENSLFMWRNYFPKSKVYGIGSDQKYVFRRGPIQTFLCERTDSTGLKSLVNKIGSDIDIVIDEGPHNPKEIVASIQTLMPVLKRDVMYVVENTDRPQAHAVIANLANYNYHVVRHHKMVSRFDRLIVVTNKIA